MTTKQLEDLVIEFVETSDNNESNKDEWYGTDRDFNSQVLGTFMRFVQRKGFKISEETINKVFSY